MLPPKHQQRYELFKHSLEAATTLVASLDDRPALKTAVDTLLTQFQTQILTLDLEELDRTIAQRVQSVQVEMDKQLRLLRMDLVFLQAARQNATTTQRQSQVRDRLHQLIRYCEALLPE